MFGKINKIYFFLVTLLVQNVQNKCSFRKNTKLQKSQLGRLHKIYSETAASFVQYVEINFRQVAQLCNMHKKNGKNCPKICTVFPLTKTLKRGIIKKCGAENAPRKNL